MKKRMLRIAVLSIIVTLLVIYLVIYNLPENKYDRNQREKIKT